MPPKISLMSANNWPQSCRRQLLLLCLSTSEALSIHSWWLDTLSNIGQNSRPGGEAGTGESCTLVYNIETAAKGRFAVRGQQGRGLNLSKSATAVGLGGDH